MYKNNKKKVLYDDEWEDNGCQWKAMVGRTERKDVRKKIRQKKMKGRQKVTETRLRKKKKTTCRESYIIKN